MLPGVPQVAAFDTAFHATLPPHAYLYALPYEWYEHWGIRRFGFHGLSHAYCAARAAELLGLPLAQLKLVTCHLGSGCSLAAVAEDARSRRRWDSRHSTGSLWRLGLARSIPGC